MPFNLPLVPLSEILPCIARLLFWLHLLPILSFQVREIHHLSLHPIRSGHVEHNLPLKPPALLTNSGRSCALPSSPMPILISGGKHCGPGQDGHELLSRKVHEKDAASAMSYEYMNSRRGVPVPQRATRMNNDKNARTTFAGRKWLIERIRTVGLTAAAEAAGAAPAAPKWLKRFQAEGKPGLSIALPARNGRAARWTRCSGSGSSGCAAPACRCAASPQSWGAVWRR